MKPVFDIITYRSFSDAYIIALAKSVKAIYMYGSERSLFALSENGNCLLCYDLLFWGILVFEIK